MSERTECLAAFRKLYDAAVTFFAEGHEGAPPRVFKLMQAALYEAEDFLDANPVPEPPRSVRIADWGKIVTAAADTLAESLEPPAQVDGPDPRD